MNEYTRRKVVAVIGSASKDLPLEVVETARHVGRGLMEGDCRLVTGGMGGVMRAVCEGARQSPSWKDGAVIGVLPGYDRTAANPFVDIILPSGMGLARNVLVVASADVVVALAGGSGTLSEMAMAWQLGKPIIALEGVGGWSTKLAGHSLDGRHSGTVHRAQSAEEAVELALKLAHEPLIEPGAIGSGWRRGST